MADINADVKHVELIDTDAGATLKEKMIGFATDTLCLIWKKTGGDLIRYWDSLALADQTGVYGANCIGMFGFKNMPPYFGGILTPGSSAPLSVFLAGMIQCSSRVIHSDTTATDWTSATGGEETLHTYTLPAATLYEFNQSLKIRVSILLDNASTKILRLYGDTDLLASITTTESGVAIFDLELVYRGSLDQFINCNVTAGQDQSPSIFQGTFDLAGDVDFRVTAEVTGGITGDASYRSMTVEYRGTIGL